MDRVTDNGGVWVDLGTINATGGHQLEIRSMTTLGSVVDHSSSLTVEADQYTETMFGAGRHQCARRRLLRDTPSLTPSVIGSGPRKLDWIARRR